MEVRILHSGRVADLVQLMRNEQVRAITADAVTNICKNNNRSQGVFAEAGAITVLAELLEESHASSVGAQKDQTQDALVRALGKI